MLGEVGTDDADRQGVLDAALEAFLDFGIRRTSMGEIAKRSGVSPATLYRRFAGKDDVVWAVGRREARRLITYVDSCVDLGASAEDQIVAMFLACMDGLRRNELLQRLLATEPDVVLPLLTIEGGPVLDLGRAYLSDFLLRLQQRNELPDFEPEPVAEMVARVALSLVLLPSTCLPLDDESAVRSFARRHLALLLGRTSSEGL
jgi:AcrR family transcriptional regulator